MRFKKNNLLFIKERLTKIMYVLLSIEINISTNGHFKLLFMISMYLWYDKHLHLMGLDFPLGVVKVLWK